MERIVFAKGKQQELLLKFLSYAGKSQLAAAKSLGIPRRTLRNWINGERTLPKGIYEKIIGLHPDLSHFSNDIAKIEGANWGRIKGGKRCYEIIRKKYGENELVRRREAGGDASIKKRLDRIVEGLPKPGDCCVLELLGALMGDGWIGISGGRKQVCFCGNLHQKAYASHIQGLLRRAFKIQGYLKFRKKFTVFYIIINSSPIFDFFRVKFNFPVGLKKKFDTGLLPSDPAGAANVIRGVFDTDGGIYFDCARGYAAPYPVIDITSHNPELLAWLSSTLTKKGFKVISLKYSIRLKTIGQVERWFNEIKPSNTIHIRKWNRWKSQYLGP